MLGDENHSRCLSRPARGTRRKTARTAASLLIFFVVGALFPSPARLRAERLPIRSYTTADGLAQDSVDAILADSHGYLWIATEEGLSRFDGQEFVNYGRKDGLPEQSVGALLETRAGDLWLASREHLCRFNPEGRERFTCATSEELGPICRIQRLLEEGSGKIWVATDLGLFLLDRGKDKPCLARVDLGVSEEIARKGLTALIEDHEGRLWVGGHAGLFRRGVDGKFDYFPLTGELPDSHVTGLMTDRLGRTWASTWTSGICLIRTDAQPGEPVCARCYSTHDGLPNNLVEDLLETSDGTIWATTTAGIARARGEGERRAALIFESFGRHAGLTDIETGPLAEDREGNLWVGGMSGGAMKVVGGGFATMTEEDGLPGLGVGSIFQDSAGRLCVVASATFACRGPDGRFIPVHPRMPRSITYFGWGWQQIHFQDRSGDWWVPTGEGLLRYVGVHEPEELAHMNPILYTTRDGLGDNNIFRLYEDQRGDIWAGTHGAKFLTRWERSTRTFHVYGKEDGITRPSLPTSFGEDRQGNLWVGFWSGGLARRRGERFEFFDEADGVPAGGIHDIHLDHAGRLWIASSRGGLGRIDSPEEAHPRIAVLTTDQGLGSDDVRCVVEDDRGLLYAGTGRGVDRLDPSTGFVRHFTTSDGLANAYVRSCGRDREGALWFGTQQGLSRLVPAPERRGPPRDPLILRVRVGGVPQPLSELGRREVAGLVLGPDARSLQIDFCSPSFQAGGSPRYQFRLQGLDTDFGPPTAQRTVLLPALGAGRYRFEVRAVAPEGVASPHDAVVSFRVLPPLWRRWWVLSLEGAMAAGAAWTLHRQRVARHVELERIRTRIATDLHDDIGASLSQIALQSDGLTRRLQGAAPEVNDRLARISGVSRELVDSMSDIVWAINPRRDRMSDLVQRMRRFALDTLDARGIALEFSAPEAGGVPLDAERRRQIFLIFKESVNNAARHSCCSKVEAVIAIGRARIEVRVRDDGRGFEPRGSYQGTGLESMRLRAEEIGGTLRIVSTPGGGTTMELYAPLSGRAGRRGGSA